MNLTLISAKVEITILFEFTLLNAQVLRQQFFQVTQAYFFEYFTLRYLVLIFPSY